MACKFIAEILIPLSESSNMFVCTCVYCVHVRVSGCILHAYTRTHTHIHKRTHTVLGTVIHVRSMKGQALHGAE